MRWGYLSAFDITINKEKTIVVSPLLQPYRYTEKTAKFLTAGYLYSLKNKLCQHGYEIGSIGEFVPKKVFNRLIKGLMSGKYSIEVIGKKLKVIDQLIEPLIFGEISLEERYPQIKKFFYKKDQKNIEEILKGKKIEEKIGEKEIDEINRNLNLGSMVLKLKSIIIDHSDIDIFSSVFKNENLKSLEITNVTFDEDYCNNLIELLKLNNGLKNLSLTNVKLTNEIIIKLAQNLSAINHSLLALDLSESTVSNKDNQNIIKLLTVLKNTKIRFLNLTRSNFSTFDRQLAIDILNMPVDIFNSDPFILFFDDCKDAALQNNLVKQEGFFRFHFGPIDFEEADEETKSNTNQSVMQKRKQPADKTQHEVKQKSSNITSHYNYEGFLIASNNRDSRTGHDSATENKNITSLDDDDANLPTLDSIQ